MQKNLKKSLTLLTVLITLLLLTGCLNYKAYYEPPEEEPEEADLLSEIAEIERELELAEEEETKEEITGAEILEEPEEPEVTLPPLEEEVDLSKLQRIEVNEDELVDLKVKVEDPDQDKVTYSFSLPLNEQGKWKTNYGDAGEYVVTLTATDGVHTVKKDILLVVKKVNVPPIIKELKDQTIEEGETIDLEPQAIDPNGDSVTLTISEPLTSGTWTTDHTSAGEYEIIVTASDGELEAKETFLLTVTDVNVLPEISGLEDITLNEGETVKIKPDITDLDEEPVKVTLLITKDGQTIAEYTDKVVWETSYTDHGTYQVIVTADDTKDQVTQEITLTIKDINMPPEIIEIILG